MDIYECQYGADSFICLYSIFHANLYSYRSINIEMVMQIHEYTYIMTYIAPSLTFRCVYLRYRIKRNLTTITRRWRTCRHSVLFRFRMNVFI